MERQAERDDWKLVDRLDAESFRQLMLEYGQDVWNYAYLMTASPTMADDVSQDVFLRVYRHIGTYRGESSIKTWLLAITRNIALNYRRSAFMRKVVLADRLFMFGAAPSAEEMALDQMQADEIWAVVMQLPLKFREVLLLDAKYGFTQKEIAKLLALSEGTVKSRLSRARRKVSAVLEKGDPVHEQN